MKKRLLITSIVMMLVVAVALSTATYAWFTSNATVSASSMTLKAGVSDADALGIGWTGYGANSFINSPVYDDGLNPMAPTALTVGTTTSEDLLFYTMTTYQDGGVFKFNETPAVDANIDPVVYNDRVAAPNTVKSFYVRNLSNANKVDTVTVTAVFGEYMVEIGAFEAGVKYFTKSGNNYVPYTGDTTPGDYIPGPTDPVVYAYVPYVLTKDTTAVKGTTYWEPSAVGSNKYQEVDGVIAETTNVEGKYEEVKADDMIRVALFTQEYRLVESGTYTSGTYYAYDPVDDVIKAATLTGGDSLKGYYSLSSAKHLLKCVLGKKDTAYVSVGSDDFDLNKVYFHLDGGVYTQTAYNATTYAANKANIYTATSTAVYGAIEKDGAVNALSYYNDVVNSYVIATNLKPGEQVDIVAYAWLDGTMLDDGRQGEVGTVSLLFSAN